MPAIENKQLIYTGVVPDGPIQPGQSLKLVTSALDTEAIPLNGGILVKSLALSVDPYMRGRIRSPSTTSYSPPFALNKPLDTYAIGRIVKSESTKFKQGSVVYGLLEFSEYSLIPPAAFGLRKLRVVENKEKLPWTVWVGAAGMPGKTAHYGLFTIGQPSSSPPSPPGQETIFVSAASGAVGQIVCQLAKSHSPPLRVLGSAGSSDKVKYLKEVIGVDVAWNYKDSAEDGGTGGKTGEVLRAETRRRKELEGPNPKAMGGVDLYFENVGGETLDLVLENMEKKGRIIGCGMISMYDTADPYRIKNLMNIVPRQIRFEGFVMPLDPEWEDMFYSEMPPKIANGQIKTLEDKYRGIENAEKAFLSLFSGKNFGKAVVDLTSEDDDGTK